MSECIGELYIRTYIIQHNKNIAVLLHIAREHVNLTEDIQCTSPGFCGGVYSVHNELDAKSCNINACRYTRVVRYDNDIHVTWLWQ